MLEVGGGKPLMKKKESGGSMKDALKRRFTVHKPQFTSDVVDAFEKIKSFSRGGYLLKIERVPEKETSSDHGGQEASLVVKWRAPIDHPTSDWIGIWPMGSSRAVRKLGRMMQGSDETPTRSHTSQPVAGKCWAFVPKGRKGIVTFSGDKLPAWEGRFRINYVLEGDPWSEQTIALQGPEFNIVDDKCAPCPRQELKGSSGGGPLSPRTGGMTFSLSYEAPTAVDEEEKQRAWREDWLASVEEADQARLLEWEAKRLPCQKGGQTLAEVTFKVPQQIRSLRSRNDSSSDSDSEAEEEEREDEEGSGSRQVTWKEKERTLTMKSEDGRGVIEGWKKNSRGGKKELRRSTSDNEPGIDAEAPRLQSSASFSPVVSIIDIDGTETVVKAPKEKQERRRGGSLRRKKPEATIALTHSSPSSIPVLHLNPTPFAEASHSLESLTLSPSFSPVSSAASSPAARPAVFCEESPPADLLGEKKFKSSIKSAKKKKKKKESAIRSPKGSKVAKASDDAKQQQQQPTHTTTTTTSSGATTSGSDVVVRPAPGPSVESDEPRTLRKSSTGSERSRGATTMERAKTKATADELKQKKKWQEQKKDGQVEEELITMQRGEHRDLFGVTERYQIEMGRVTFSEEFIFYFLIFALVVFLIFHNAFHELRLVLIGHK